MPFTLAHPAAVLPFMRQPFIPIALVAGAMAPDLPYFAMVSSASPAWYAPMLNGANSHDFSQILTVGLPLALVLAGFLWLVATPLRWALPASWVPEKPALRGRPPSSARVALWIFYSLMLGLVTHLAWDAFTHFDGWAVQRLPLLASEPVSGIPVYRILQHGSTVAGLLILVLWYLKRPKPSTPAPSGSRGATLRLAPVAAVLLLPVLLAAGRAVALRSGLGTPFGLEEFLWLVCTRGGAALVAAMAAYAVVWRVVVAIRWVREKAAARR